MRQEFESQAHHTHEEIHRKVAEFEENGPEFVKDLISLRNFVEKNGDHTFPYTIIDAKDNDTDFRFISRGVNTIDIVESEISPKTNKKVLKTRVVYGSDAEIRLVINESFFENDLLENLEEPSYTHLPKKIFGNGKWRDDTRGTINISANADSLGENTVNFIENFLTRAKEALPK